MFKCRVRNSLTIILSASVGILSGSDALLLHMLEITASSSSPLLKYGASFTSKGLECRLKGYYTRRMGTILSRSISTTERDFRLFSRQL